MFYKPPPPHEPFGLWGGFFMLSQNELVSPTNQLLSHSFHQQAEHFAHALFLVAMRLQVRPLQIPPFVYLQHHRLVAFRIP